MTARPTRARSAYSSMPTFNGKVAVDSSWDDRATIQDHLLFTVGQLNGMTAVGRVDKAELSNITKTTSRRQDA